MSKLINLKKLYSKPLFVNITSLGLLQIANYAIPILIIPFVTRALGADFFGKASYAQNIIAYLTIIVNYGFEYSATQDIALHRDDKSKLRTIFWTVIRFKIILLIISFLILGILYFTFYRVNEDPLLYFYAALINIGFVMFPTWFFQGIEKMKDMAIFSFIIKLLGAILVIWVVNTPADYKNYILILSLSYVLIGIVSFLYVVKKYDLISNHEKDKALSNNVIKKGAPIFWHGLFAGFYAIAGITIVGIYLTDKDVGLYAGVYKIIMAITVILGVPIHTSIFPIISRKFNESIKEGFLFFRKTLLWSSILGIVIGCFVFFMSPYIVNLFLGHEFSQAIDLLKLFSPLPCLLIVASFFIIQGLFGMQLHRYAPVISIAVCVFSVTLSFILIPRIGLKGAVIALLLSEVLDILLGITLLVIVFIKKKWTLTK